MSSSPLSTAETLDLWIERDLSGLSERGELRPAFCVQPQLRQLDDIVCSGRAAILVGESGVGKSAIVYELIRILALPESMRPADLQMIEKFRGRRILQISLRRRAAGLRQPHTQMGEEVLRLVDALVATKEKLALFFRDLDLAYQFNLETHFENLAFKFDGPIIGEGQRSTVQNMLEYHPELDQHYVTLVVQEPGLERMKQILDRWSQHHSDKTGATFERDALLHALYLSHRFLSRSRMPRKALDLVEQVASTNKDNHVQIVDVLNRFCDSHRVPRDLVDPNITLDLTKLREHFAERILGQDEALDVVMDVIGLIKSGMSDARRPFGVFFFVGPTGVGKTHLAQLLAEFLFGDKERMLRINMTDYSEPGKAETLFGSPNGTSPAMTRGVLAQRVSGHPFAVLLLDEFEKAHESVHDRLLQLMDEGTFINGAGETVSCRSMIIIATSNSGAEVYRGEGFGFAPKDLNLEAKDLELSRRLRETFRFEFLNRFDRIVHFHPLTQRDIRTIALREFSLIKERAGFEQRKLELDIDESLIDWISVQGYHPDFGARFLRRTIERHVATAIATAIVRESPAQGAVLSATVRLGKVVCYVSCEIDSPDVEANKAVERQQARKKKPKFVSQIIEVVSPEDIADSTELCAKADQLLTESTGIVAELSDRKQERQQLLTQMNQSTFWGDQGKRADILLRFREIEVLLRAQERAATSVTLLQEERDTFENTRAGQWRLQQRMDAATGAIQEWRRGREEANESSLWMQIACADKHHADESRVEDLAALELAWCRRLGLRVSVVAYAEVPREEGETSDRLIEQIFLEVAGVGAKSFLHMEEGLHRFSRNKQIALNCICKVWDKGNVSALPLRLRSSRSRLGPLGVHVDCKSTVRISTNREIELLGERGENFATLVAFLDELDNDDNQAAVTIARTYCWNGEGVIDPRTGTTMKRTKDVMAGNLDRFLEAWRISN